MIYKLAAISASPRTSMCIMKKILRILWKGQTFRNMNGKRVIVMALLREARESYDRVLEVEIVF